MKEDKRRAVRVVSQNGLTIMRCGGSQPVACRVTNLSEGGCRLFVEGRHLEVWNKINKPGQMLELVMSLPPHLDRFIVNADLRNVRPSENPAGIELGVQFRPMEPKRCGILRLALLKLATERLRSQKPVEPIDPATAQAAAPASAASEQAQAGKGREGATAPNKGGSQFLQTPPAVIRPAELSAIPSGKKKIEDRVSRRTLGSNAISYWQDPYHGKRIGDVLVGMGKLSQAQIDTYAEEARHSRERFGQFLVKRGVVKSSEILRALSLATGIPTTDLSDVTIRRTFREIFPIEMMRRYEFIPFDASTKMVCIATASPFPEPVLNEIREATTKRVEVFLADEQLVLQLIDKTAEESLQEASQMKNRRFSRFNMPLPASYFFCTSNGERLEDSTYAGQTMNISEGGFRIEGPRADLGSFGNIHQYGLYVQLSVKFLPHEFTALCKPVYVYEKETIEEPKFPFEMGLQIMDINANSKQQLMNVLEIVKKLTNPTSV